MGIKRTSMTLAEYKANPARATELAGEGEVRVIDDAGDTALIIARKLEPIPDEPEVQAAYDAGVRAEAERRDRVIEAACAKYHGGSALEVIAYVREMSAGRAPRIAEGVLLAILEQETKT